MCVCLRVDAATDDGGDDADDHDDGDNADDDDDHTPNPQLLTRQTLNHTTLNPMPEPLDPV